jgi:hypothetical protein
MIYEDALWYKRGDLVEFKMNLAGGSKTCRGLVLNTAVLLGRGARQIWILDMDESTPEQQSHWINKKHIIHEEDIVSSIPKVVLGADTILRDNPVAYPVLDGTRGTYEISAITATVAVPSSEN